MTSGFSMRAMTRSLPPRLGRVSMSMAKTRFRRAIQVMGARGLSGFSWRGLRFGTTDSRCLQFGANTPWNRLRSNRGRGTNAAGRAMKSSTSRTTWAQFDACVADGGCGAGDELWDRGWGRGDGPVIGVPWELAKAYVSWLSNRTGASYRLPSESEWEYAGRAGTQTAYWWAEDIGENQANCKDCGDQWDVTAPVGSFAANPWGLHDVHGNVWEWTQDCWNDGYEGAPEDGNPWESGECNRRVIRSGSAFWEHWWLRVHIRTSASAVLGHGTSGDLGFRVARKLD